MRKPREYTVGNAHNRGFRTGTHLGGLVPWDDGDTGAGGRVAFHGNRREPRCLGRCHGGRLVGFSLDQADELQSGLLAFVDQRFQRLLLAGIRRPTDHQAIDRRTLHDRQGRRILPFSKNLGRIRREALRFFTACDVQGTCRPSHRYGLCA